MHSSITKAKRVQGNVLQPKVTASRVWLLAVCCLYGMTAGLKLLELWKNRKLALYVDPVIPAFTFRESTGLAFLLEAALLAFCCSRAVEGRKWVGVLLLSSVFAAYKIAFVLSGVGLPCACLGGLPAALGWSLLTTDIVTLGLLVATWSVSVFFLRR